jgi:hypothetical protein
MPILNTDGVSYRGGRWRWATATPVARLGYVYRAGFLAIAANSGVA